MRPLIAEWALGGDPATSASADRALFARPIVSVVQFAKGARMAILANVLVVAYVSLMPDGPVPGPVV